jgi:putative heme-binding domain-containing protein
MLVFGAAVLAVLSPGPLAAQPRSTEYAPADIQYGARTYGAQCTICHGATGDGVAGVDLASGRFKRATSDAELRRVITSGVTGTAMPAFKFDVPELTAIVAYLRNMRGFDRAKTPIGDPSRGKATFEGRGECATCHRVLGKGPRVAPDLTEIGTLRTAEALQRTLLDPTGSLQPVNRSVRAVTRDGKTIRGRRLNEDTYTVQLIDEQERLVSLTKANLKEYEVIMKASMPSYQGTLTDAELADVLAYLLSLKGL